MESFFSLFKIQWPDCPYDIYLNTENKSYICNNLNIKNIKTGNGVAWTTRLKKALSEIDADYILFMLEDFFLLEPVNGLKLDMIVAEMQKESEVGFIFFTPIGVKYDIEYQPDTIFSDVSKYADYRVNACIGLWKKEFLLQMLYLDGNPWEFEHNATRLSWISKYRCCVINPEYSTVLSYSIRPSEGYGITQRKWLPKNKELFSKYNIDVNFDGLGIKNEKPKAANNNVQTEKNKPYKIISAVLKRVRKYKKRLKKNIRFIKDMLFLKPKFTDYCNDIKETMK